MPTARIEKCFNNFIESYTNESNIYIGSATYSLYSKFIIESYGLELYNFMCKDEQFLKLNSNWV
ncbi:hypothetical protein EFE22_08650 [Lactobacillus delbrueckii subsp. lactis]|nr:hypothetical protein [Lactobacillus delbrueckii subsp. lactis]